MNVAQAASNTLLLWSKNQEIPEAKRENTGTSKNHQAWLLKEIQEERVTGEKAHRWLSWAQGCLTMHGVLTLTDCKYANVLS